MLAINKDFLYQKELEEKDTLSLEEMWWLKTHPRYNTNLGYPILLFDTIKLEKNKEHEIIIKLEKNDYPLPVYSIIRFPAIRGRKTKDYLTTDSELIDRFGNISFNKKVQCIELEFQNNKTFKLNCFSESGFINVNFCCDFFDENQKINTRVDSSLHRNIGMIKKVVNNKNMYYCKTPYNDDFEHFVFSIEIKDNQGTAD